MEELIEAAGGLKTGAAKVISGGPMMGFAMFDLHVPCVKQHLRSSVWKRMLFQRHRNR